MQPTFSLQDADLEKMLWSCADGKARQTKAPRNFAHIMVAKRKYHTLKGKQVVIINGNPNDMRRENIGLK